MEVNDKRHGFQDSRKVGGVKPGSRQANEQQEPVACIVVLELLNNHKQLPVFTFLSANELREERFILFDEMLPKRIMPGALPGILVFSGRYRWVRWNVTCSALCVNPCVTGGSVFFNHKELKGNVQRPQGIQAARLNAGT
jgi:hypothetical protein